MKYPRKGIVRSSNRKYRRYFKHYRTGKVYDAHDYGYKAWPIG